MSVQTAYNFATQKGVAGGLYDLSPYAVDSRLNAEQNGVMKFGMGVVRGPVHGNNVALPQASIPNQFEGIVLTGYTEELDMGGNLSINNNVTVGVLRYGKAWARIKANIAPAYGNDLYLITKGTNAGLFTMVTDPETKIKVAGRFIGSKGTGDVAPVEIYNQATEATTALITNMTAEFLAADEYAKALPLGDYTSNLTSAPWLQVAYNRSDCDTCTVIIAKEGEETYTKSLPVTPNPNAFFQCVLGTPTYEGEDALDFEMTAGEYHITLVASKDGNVQSVLQTKATHL